MWTYPLKDWKTLRRGSVPFGVKYPKTKAMGKLGGQRHVGTDIMCPVGTPVYAPCDGFVKTVWGKDGGNTILFKEEIFGYLHRMLHNSKFVKRGQVQKGDLIAYSGQTGKAFGSHVHYDISKNGKLELENFDNFIDPEEFYRTLAIEEIKKNMIKISVLCGQPHDFDLVVNDFASHGIDIEVTSRIMQTELEWKGGLVDKQKLMLDYGSYANGCDIFVIMTYDWHSPAQGYLDPHKAGLRENLFGFEYIFIDETGEVWNPTETFKYEDPRLRSFAHELFHAFFKMAGKQDDLGNGNWKVHELNNRGALFKEHGIDFTKIHTRNNEDFYRLYKKTNTIIEQKVTKDMVGWFKSGLLYWYLFGFRQSL